MNEQLKIYVDRLKDGHVEKINEKLLPNFIGIEDENLLFIDPVDINGEAYLADDRLVVHLNLLTYARSPCIVCNREVAIKLAVANYYHTEEIKNIKGAVFDLSDLLREMILLEVPQFVECRDGKCPERKQLEPFLKKSDSIKEDQREYHPFDQLSLDDSLEGKPPIG